MTTEIDFPHLELVYRFSPYQNGLEAWAFYVRGGRKHLPLTLQTNDLRACASKSLKLYFETLDEEKIVRVYNGVDEVRAKVDSNTVETFLLRDLLDLSEDVPKKDRST